MHMSAQIAPKLRHGNPRNHPGQTQARPCPTGTQAHLIKARHYRGIKTIVGREGYAPASGAVVVVIGHSSRAAHSDKE